MTPRGVELDDPQVFPPTLREVMVRPQWLGVLFLCLVVAGVFAWLGQWQLERAIDTDPPPPGMTEEVQPLADIVETGAYLPEQFVGQRVELVGEWVPGDFEVVSTRFQDGVEGYWVTGQLRVADRAVPTSLAVALGWAETRAQADAAAAAFSVTPPAAGEITGRLISDEGPALPGPQADPYEMSRMSPPALLDRWSDTEGLDVYRPYLTLATAPTGLHSIHSPAPDELPTVNWLNVFYAVEWVIFACFAFYLWYRLAKDAWEREVEALEDEAAEREGDGGRSGAASEGGASASRATIES